MGNATRITERKTTSKTAEVSLRLRLCIVVVVCIPVKDLPGRVNDTYVAAPLPQCKIHKQWGSRRVNIYAYLVFHSYQFLSTIPRLFSFSSLSGAWSPIIILSIQFKEIFISSAFKTLDHFLKCSSLLIPSCGLFWLGCRISISI